MSALPLILSLRDAALEQQLARWLDDEVIDYRLGSAAEATDEPAIWLTDIASLRDAVPGKPGTSAIPPGSQRRALIVAGASTSWDERALAAAHGAAQFVGVPASRQALMAAIRATADQSHAKAVRVVLLGPRDAATSQVAGALSLADIEPHVESDPVHLFEALQALRPDVLVLLPGLAGASPPEVLRMIRNDLAWDDLMLLTVVPTPAMAAELPSGTSALIAPVDPEALARAVVDRARRRRALVSMPQLYPLLALQDQERAALDAHALVSITDHRGHIVYANDHFCRTSGYAREELLGRSHRIVKSGQHPAEFYAGLWHTIARGEVWQGELCNRRKDGSLYWVSTTIMPVGDPEAGTRRYLSIRTDITAVKAVQFKLRRRVRLQRALDAVRRQLVECDRTMLLRLAPRILRLASRLLGSSRIRWQVPRANGGEDTVAEWPITSGAGHAPEAKAAANLVTPVGPASGIAGSLHWSFNPGDEVPRDHDLAFAHTLAGLLGSAWRRTAAELSQRASELALTAMLRAFPGIVAAVTEDGVYEFANEVFANHLGRVPDEIVGKHIEDVLGPDRLPEIRRRQDRIVAEGRSISFEHELRTQGDAEPRFFSTVHFSAGGQAGIPRRFFQIGIDVTERRRMAGLLEALLQTTQSEARLQRLISAQAMDLGGTSGATLDARLQSLLSDVGQFFEVDRASLFLFSCDGVRLGHVYEWCSIGIDSGQAAMRGLSLEELPWLRQRLVDGQAPIHIPDVEDLPPEAHEEQALLRRRGIRSCLSVPVVATGRTIGFIGLDAVRRRLPWSESAIQGLAILGQVIANAWQRVESEQALTALKERAEAASAAKSEFLASMSHELRTPMNAVLGFGQLLELTLELQPRELSYVKEILKGGRHLLTLIDDVLDLARIESGRLDLSPEPIRLAEVAEDCLRLMQPLALRRGIDISLDIGHRTLLADRVRLKQVMVNLLSNAIKYNVEGGRDFVSKPFDRVELLMRVRNLLDAHLAHRLAHERREVLENMVQSRTRELQSSRLMLLQKLGKAAEFRDEETGNHILRMSHTAALLAKGLGWSAGAVELLLNAAPMHDIGKIGIPDRILLKPGRLDAQEWAVMQTHAELGARMLEGAGCELTEMARQVALTHHEKWDGSGYPRGLAGPAISEAGRICAVADVFDALLSARPYKRPWAVDAAVEHVRIGAGTHFDPDVVDCFLKHLPQVAEIRARYPDEAGPGIGGRPA